VVDSVWLPSLSFADIAGIKLRRASRALERAHDGHTWHNHHLVVRRVRGRGGRSGWSYEVRLDSLPEALRERYQDTLYKDSPAHDDSPSRALVPVEPELPLVAPSVEEVAREAVVGRLAHWRYSVIQEALKHPRHSVERGAALREIVADRHVKPDGTRVAVSERAAQDWVMRYEVKGLHGLATRPRADKGRRRVFVTRKWDRTVPLDAVAMARVEEALRRYIRSLWAGDLKLGWSWMVRLASERLARATVEAGFNPGPDALKSVCRLPRSIVERERHYRAIAIHDKDRKRHFDASQPRVRRTLEGRAPMEILVGDVHHMDILMTRPDGTTFTPKAVCWQDWVTNRIFVHPVFLKKGQGIRQEHVIESFVAMATHPEWGMPRHLYLDNGGEYNWAPFIEDAMRLVEGMRCFQRRGMIIKAQPYNAPAKAIEGLFGVLERGVFSTIPGWIGGDRMNKKTANLGKAVKPFPGNEAAFREALTTAIAAYETHPQSGSLAGRSPRQAFAQAVEAGWRRTDIEPLALRAAFAKDVVKTIRQGGFKHGGEVYTARELQRLAHDTRVVVRAPIAQDHDNLAVLDPESRKLICVARIDAPYDALDPEGAREAGRRRRENAKGIADQRQDVDKVDLIEMLGRVAANASPAPVPESAGVIRLTDGLDEIGRRLAEAPEAVEDREARKRARERAKIDASLDRINANYQKLRAGGG